VFGAATTDNTVVSFILNQRPAGFRESFTQTAYIERLETSSAAATATATPGATATSGTTPATTTRSASSTSTVRDFLAGLILRLRGVVDKQVVQR